MLRHSRLIFELLNPWVRRKMTSSSITLQEASVESIRANLLKSSGGHVSLVKDETAGIATLLLDRPEKRNALSGQMMVELRDCVQALENWGEGKAVILSGKGSNFCAGADLDFVRTNNSSRQAGYDMSSWMQGTMDRLRRLPLISVCLVHGPTLGGGAELSVSCDFIVAADNVKYGFVHGNIGLTPAWGGGVGLVQKLGQRKALDVLLTARTLTADECVDIGLAEIVVSSEGALAKTVEWLTPRLQFHHSITQAFKKVILNANPQISSDVLSLERNIFTQFWGGDINLQALHKNVTHVKKS